MIASLPMYRRPELVDAHNRYWALIRDGLRQAGIDSPSTLTQEADEFATWTDPSLVLSQTCGMPYRNDLHGRVTLVGTPDFGVADCRPGFYRSVMIARRADHRTRVEDFADAVFAYNQDHSQSGYCAPYQHAAARGFWFQHRVRSGGHLASARAVAEGDADIAAIDAVTWRLIERYEPFAPTLTVIDRTDQQPGLPYITALGADRQAVFTAVADAIAGLAAPDREALGIRSLVPIPAETYLAVENPPPEITDSL